MHFNFVNDEGKIRKRLVVDMTETKKYDTVIFDLDGTLLYTLEDLTDCVNHTMDVFGYPERTIREIRQFVGNGIGKLIRRSIPEYVSDSQCEIVLAEFKEYYTDNCQRKTRAYDGILDLIEKLKAKGIKLAIVSNKNDKAVKELNDKYFNGYIDVAIGDRNGKLRKPAPDSVYEALEQLGSDVSHAIYVGDSDVDIETANNAGMMNVLVTWGFRDKELLVEKGGKNFIDSPGELLKYFDY